MKSNSTILILALVAAGALVGCGDTTRASSLPAASAGVSAIKDTPKVNAEAGIPVTDTSGMSVFTVANSMNFGARSNPFSLMWDEVRFDREQTAAHFVTMGGGYANYYELPDDAILPEDQLRKVPIPAWRLSGIFVGEAVVAILDMGGGQTMEIRPGMQIPGTDWVVVSIDTEKATLRNTKNVLPKEVTIALSSQIFGDPGTGGGTGGGGDSNPQGAGGVGAPPPGGGLPPGSEN